MPCLIMPGAMYVIGESGFVTTYRALVRRPVQKGGLVQQHHVGGGEGADHAATVSVDENRARDDATDEWWW